MQNYIAKLREDLNLSQTEFGNLLGVHAMTVSKWERGVLKPNSYQMALMQQFRATADAQKVDDTVKNLLIGAGIVAALIWLLSKGKK
jgi:transcriptional regulator with XRE-family HTH domain